MFLHRTESIQYVAGSLRFAQVPTGILSDKEQKQLLYRRKLQFGTGDKVAELVPSSTARQLADRKRQITKALKDVQSKTANGSLHQLMMQHFRETTNHQCFYSLSVDVMEQLPMKQMTAALTSMLSVKGKPGQPAGTLPLPNEVDSLPLADRVMKEKEPIEDHAFDFLHPLEDDAEYTVAQGPGFGTIGDHQSGSDIKKLIEFCQLDGLLVFKVVDKNPHLKKRPTHSVDNLISSDLAIRLYKVEKYVAGKELWVSFTSNPQVPLVQFFGGKDPQKLIDQMLCWKLGTGADDGNMLRLDSCGKAFQKRLACPLTIQSIDLSRNLKPTHFELYLELREKGWSFREWGGKPADLKHVRINLDPTSEVKVVYAWGYFHMLCLATLPAISGHLENKRCLQHAQLETYYETAFKLGQQSRFAALQTLRANQTAQFYRTAMMRWHPSHCIYTAYHVLYVRDLPQLTWKFYTDWLAEA